MSTWPYWLAGIAVMAAVTYLPRALPLSLMRRRVESPFFQSFLYYMPVAVLGAMTFPDVLYATSSLWSAFLGLLAALLMAFWGKGLLLTALVATVVVLATEGILAAAGIPLYA